MTGKDVSSVRMSRGEWNKVRAYATVTLTNGMSIRGIKLIQGSKGLFVGMPSRKTKKDGEDAWEDSVYFEDKDDWGRFSTFLVDHYNSQDGGTPSSGGGSEGAGDNDESSFF